MDHKDDKTLLYNTTVFSKIRIRDFRLNYDNTYICSKGYTESVSAYLPNGVKAGLLAALLVKSLLFQV